MGNARAIQGWRRRTAILAACALLLGCCGVLLGTVGASADPATSWYLAEGSTNWGFSTYITIENAGGNATSVLATFMPMDGSAFDVTVDLPATSQTQLTNDYLVSAMGGPKDFSTRVTAPADTIIAVDRTMTWTGKGASYQEAHNSVGVRAPASTWFLPEGSSDWGFETWTLIQNPNPTETATVTLTYMTDNAGAKVVHHTVAPHSRQSFSMLGDIGADDASIQVDSNIPVIPERAMYRNNRREGHESIGTTTKSQDYFLAEGSANWGFTTFVLVQNPNNAQNQVTLTYMNTDGSNRTYTINMAANSRQTVKVNANAAMVGKDFSTRVHGTLPIIAERAMYWMSPGGETMHDSIGTNSGGNDWRLPDGDTSGGHETYTLVQNPGATAVNIAVSYFPAGGGTPLTLNDTVQPGSRKTYNMKTKVVSGRAACRVTGDAGDQIIVERAMYWNSRSAGTDSLGAR